MDSILSATNVSKAFGEFVALQNVSLEIDRGSVLGLLGPNGAGKTTLIRILTGITGPDSGSIKMQNGDGSIPSISYLPEERGLYKSMKVWEQALYLTQLKGLEKDVASSYLAHWFEIFQMMDWLNKPVEALSKGMQQRLQFVITVASKPDILILDEPFSGFDPVNAETIKKELLALSQTGVTVILSTHDMSSVEELCTDICLINKGKSIINDKLDTVRAQYGKNLFDLNFTGSKVAFANALGHRFELVSIKSKEETHTAEVRGHGTPTSNELLRALIPHIEIHSFREQLPTMNDIFLDLVNEKHLESPEHE